MGLLQILIKESPARAFAILGACGLAGISEAAAVLIILEVTASAKFHLPFLVIILLIVGLFLFSSYFYLSRGSILAEKAMESMVVSICDKIRLSELPEIEKIEKSDAYNNIWNARALSDAALNNLYMFSRVMAVATIWIYVAFVSLAMATCLTLFFLLYFMVYEVFQKVGKSEAAMENRIVVSLFNAFDHILHGFKEVRINRRKNRDLFENHINPLIGETEKVRFQNTLFISEFFGFTSVSFMTFASMCALFLSGYFTLLPVITLVILYLWEPIMTLSSGIPDVIEGKAAMDRLASLDERLGNPERTDLPSRVGPGSDFRIMALENAGFSYEGQNGFSLGPVSMEIRAGEIFFIAGGNGSGKSTLLKLICGLYAPSSGRITMDGIPVDMRRHRHLFSAIFTDFHLFDSLYGIKSPGEDFVNSLMSDFDLLKTSSFSNGRFSSLALSAGQRKRLAFVVAMLENRPVYIFDEWAAEQDPEFREHFYTNLLPSLVSGGGTVIAVTHDERWFHVADRVAKLEYGKIV
jgi:putative pyoverdin transport system ATP-binding/permease protein